MNKKENRINFFPKYSFVFIIFVIASMLNITSSYIHALDEFKEYFDKANEFTEKKQYDRAVTQLMKILDKSPENIEARLRIANIKLIQLSHEESYDQVKKVLKIDPENKEAFNVGNKIFLDALLNRDYETYRNFIFYTCDNIFNIPNPEVEFFLINLLKNHQNKFINSNNQINAKGNITIYSLSNIYFSFQNVLPVLTKYFTYKDIEGNYTARIAIKNIQEEEETRKNPDKLKNKK